MDGWLKALVAAACVVVIAGGAHLGFTAYSSYSSAHAFEAKCGQFLALNRAVIATRGENQTFKNAALSAMRTAPRECLDAAQEELRRAY